MGAGSRAPGLAHAHSAAVPSSPHGTSGLCSLPGFGPICCEALVPRVYTLLLLGASCLGRLRVTCPAVAVHSQFPRPPRSSSSAPYSVGARGFLPAWPPSAPFCHISPRRGLSAPRSLFIRLPRSAQPHPLGNYPSCHRLWSSLRASCLGTVVTGSGAVSLHPHRSLPPNGGFCLVL